MVTINLFPTKKVQWPQLTMPLYLILQHAIWVSVCTFSLIMLLLVILTLVLIPSFNALLQLAGVHISSGKVAKTAMMVNSMGENVRKPTVH